LCAVTKANGVMITQPSVPVRNRKMRAYPLAGANDAVAHAAANAGPFKLTVLKP
jgi:hypothetical protein